MSFRVLLPHEHSLWAWVLGPLALAFALSPTLGTALQIGASLAAFGVWNAGNLIFRGKGSGAIGPALMAAVVAVSLAGGALLTVENQSLFGQVFLTAAVLSHVVSLTTGGTPPRDPRFEWVGIMALSLLGAGIAIAGGADASTALMAQLTLAAWFTLSLWYIKGLLSTVLRRREPWAGGAFFGLGLCALTGALSVATGHWLFLVVLPLYGVRVALQKRPEHPSEIKRFGMGEAGWSLLAVASLSGIAQLT